jgi:hypothetical protein
MAMRAGNGNATDASTTAQISSSQPPATVAARTEGWRSIRLQDGRNSVGAPDGATECRVAGIVGDIARDQIADQVGIGQFEKFDEGGAFVACGKFVSTAQIPQQQQVEFLHAAAAAPFQFSELSAAAQASSS